MTPPVLSVRDVRGNSSGTYYALTEATKGGLGSTATVTVKFCSNYDRFVCLTCLTNSCAHTRYVAGMIANDRDRGAA